VVVIPTNKTAIRQDLADLNESRAKLKEALEAKAAADERLTVLEKQFADTRMEMGKRLEDTSKRLVDIQHKATELARALPPANSPIFVGLKEEEVESLKSNSWVDLAVAIKECATEMDRELGNLQKKLDDTKQSMQEKIDTTTKALVQCETRVKSTQKFVEECARRRQGLTDCQQQAEKTQETIEKLKAELDGCTLRVKDEYDKGRKDEEESFSSIVEQEKRKVQQLLEPEIDKLLAENRSLVEKLKAVNEATEEEKTIWREEYLKLAEELGVNIATKTIP
jgi:predicted  nucleic acid-binding Zn-ribbon protein